MSILSHFGFYSLNNYIYHFGLKILYILVYFAMKSNFHIHFLDYIRGLGAQCTMLCWIHVVACGLIYLTHKMNFWNLFRNSIRPRMLSSLPLRHLSLSPIRAPAMANNVHSILPLRRCPIWYRWDIYQKLGLILKVS